MGTTIRRQPITTSIPAAPDYKFLNITNFGGLELSSNPFVVGSNTASDCLNVYVDEYNTLTTRPRLEFKFDLLDTVENFELLSVYELHNGYLVHGLENKTPKMWVVLDDGARKEVTGITPPATKGLVFEQDDGIYIIANNYYKLSPAIVVGTNNVVSYALSLATGYIPTITVGKMKKTTSFDSAGETTTSYNTDGSPLEQLNIVSDYYKESYYWDGSWNPESVKIYDDDVIENNYYTEKRLNLDNFYNDEQRLFRYMYANICGYLGVLSSESDYHWVVLYNSDGITDDDTYYALAAMNKETGLFDISKTVKITAPNVYPTKVVATDDGLNIGIHIDSAAYLYGRTSLNDAFTETVIDTNWDVRDLYSATIAPIFMIVSVFEGNTIGCSLCEKQSNNKFNYQSYPITHIAGYASYNYSYCLSYDGQHIYEFYSNLNDSSDYLFARILKSTPNNAYTISKPFWEGLSANLSEVNVKLFASPVDEDLVIVGDMSTPTTSYYAAWYYQGAPGNKYAVEVRLKERMSYDAGVVFSRGPLSDFVYVGKYYFSKSNPNKSLIYTGIEFQKDTYITDTERIYYDFQSIITGGFAYDSSEPLMIVTRHINTLPAEKYSKLLTYRTAFKTSQLYARFDNCLWFASGNAVVHSQNNDVTYIPFNSYAALGENHEHITGLNVVNDDVLMAYKKDRLYVITSTTINNLYTYSYTETKNTIGNVPLGAPIVTTLTEMPTLVSYDGIYALNQLENVQSGDRITTLISAAINPKWLNENHDAIDSCITINKLYWTLYILPYKEISKFTKVFLLDNRTQMWYYWELPIYVKHAMIKDNIIHFVTDAGFVYSVQTSDLINEYNPEITEYYDFVDNKKQIIPWHWYSQILSLNTINYSKRLIDTTFILTDTDTQDEYALDYSFKAWRKSVSETNSTTISSNIHYVQSTTKRTMIPRFNFIQIKLDHTQDDFDNNKLRLVGLGLKYVLLEGLY